MGWCCSDASQIAKTGAPLWILNGKGRRGGVASRRHLRAQEQPVVLGASSIWSRPTQHKTSPSNTAGTKQHLHEACTSSHFASKTASPAHSSTLPSPPSPPLATTTRITKPPLVVREMSWPSQTNTLSSRSHLSSSPSRSIVFILPYIMGTAKAMPAAPPIPAQRGHCLPSNDEKLRLRRPVRRKDRHAESQAARQPGARKAERAGSTEGNLEFSSKRADLHTCVRPEPLRQTDGRGCMGFANLVTPTVLFGL